MQQEDPDIDDDWVYLNFNDFVMSLNTLFSVMWQNDWEAIVHMYELAYDHGAHQGFVIAFFVTFIELANLIFINIIIAFIIDTYQSIDLTLKAESDARKLKNKKINPETAEAGSNSLLRELNNNPAQFTRIMEILNQQQE